MSRLETFYASVLCKDRNFFYLRMPSLTSEPSLSQHSPCVNYEVVLSILQFKKSFINRLKIQLWYMVFLSLLVLFRNPYE